MLNPLELSVYLLLYILTFLSENCSSCLRPFFFAATRCNGNRGDQFPAGNLFVAVSEGLWDNGAACGRRYRLRCMSGSGRRPCKGGTIDVRVVDYCRKRPCPSTIALSSDAFSEISRSPNAKINIEYIQYVSLSHYT